MYCFQLELGFSFNVILQRKYLLHFPSFVPDVYKINLDTDKLKAYIC